MNSDEISSERTTLKKGRKKRGREWGRGRERGRERERERKRGGGGKRERERVILCKYYTNLSQ